LGEKVPQDSMADDGTSFREKLERSRTELLDLSGRNRLLNVPRKSKSAKTIEVVDELSSEIFRILVTEEKSMTFLPGRRAPGSGESLNGEDDEEIADLAQPEDDSADDRGVAHRHSDTKLQTRLTSEGLQKRLLSMHYDARTLQEEQGVNILFLALGMLKWFDADNSDKERYAPLILVPVVLERGNAAEKFKLKRLADDITPNLSLEAMLKKQFGLVMPSFEDEDQPFDPTEYFARMSEAISGHPRWEIVPNDIVLGFFSFSKFLMYRDLDPAMWPTEGNIEDHPIISSLFGDGFESDTPLISEDAFIDSHITPAELVHIVDADSSQTVAIHEALSGRHLVIQGPPGTGKSQTIANIIAASVAKGKKVLFVAEKMAALEVVKRRLDSNGVGAICLELHSHKSNKRNILAELKKTWDLGKPNGGDDGTLIRQLTQYRDELNAHVARTHTRHSPSGLTPYQVIGHMVRLQAAGRVPPEVKLDGSVTWTKHDKEDRELRLQQLAERIQDIGLPGAHPWRGVRLPQILPNQIHRLVERVNELRSRVLNIRAERDKLQSALSIEAGSTLSECARLAAFAERIALAPALQPEALMAGCWANRTGEVAELVAVGEIYAATRAELSGVVLDAAWDTDLTAARQHIAIHGGRLFRFLSGEYKRAFALFRSVLSGPPPKTLADRLKLADKIISARKAATELAKADLLGREAYASAWRGEKSDWSALRAAIGWFETNPASVAGEIRRVAAAVSDHASVGATGERISAARPGLLKDLAALISELDLDVKVAFGVSTPEEIDLHAMTERFEVWAERSEDLTKWIAYRAKADHACAAGLSELVERLANGTLDVQTVVPEFEMAYYDALLTLLVNENPELAQFDGAGHSRLVDEFREADKRRIRLAVSEVAAAHFTGMPRQDGGAGPVGILKGEFSRKRGHLPVRQLMKKAGAAIQAIKPVFMMSPLSVAQFLEPGAVEFDILVIDEASQIQPVDALGTMARCKQIVVVGDDQQLPPTSFFNRVLSGDDDEDDEGDGSIKMGDIESILGLCTSKGLPSRLLRWHYRSRHQSLIAVSNLQFYENRLYIVPSPWNKQAGMGLRFNHIPHATFDRGKTGVNLEEAKTVAEAAIRHARENPNLSLGIATFSIKQRRAVLDELERLRRLNPDTEAFFNAGHPAEPFFVKNLENVQGDERDVIFISVGYGRGPEGYMRMDFGPLNREGGERRLNVLISRAKRRCEVYSSITDEDIDLERAKGHGVYALKLFLNFARTGKLSVGVRGEREHDSIFEEQVAAALISRGYDVHPQVGLAGFFIDLAIGDRERPGRYVLGIECDGASYHSSRSARDRDRLRQAVLEDHGWIIHRIWSTDWFYRPKEQIEKTIAAIEAAKEELASRDTKGTKNQRAVPVEVVTVERSDVIEVGLDYVEPSLATPYEEASLSVPTHIELHEVNSKLMGDIVARVVQVEGPIHGDEITARIRTLWGLQRAGSRIRPAVERGIRSALSLNAIVRHGEFCSLPGVAPKVRDRANVLSPSLRKPEMLPPSEIKSAAVSFVDLNLGATEEEVITGISRLFGFKATSAQLRDVLLVAILEAVEEGNLVQQGGLFKKP
jgi:very-short-patch-repair endonuclease